MIEGEMPTAEDRGRNDYQQGYPSIDLNRYAFHRTVYAQASSDGKFFQREGTPFTAVQQVFIPYSHWFPAGYLTNWSMIGMSVELISETEGHSCNQYETNLRLSLPHIHIPSFLLASHTGKDRLHRAYIVATNRMIAVPMGTLVFAKEVEYLDATSPERLYVVELAAGALTLTQLVVTDAEPKTYQLIPDNPKHETLMVPDAKVASIWEVVGMLTK